MAAAIGCGVVAALGASSALYLGQQSKDHFTKETIDTIQHLANATNMISVLMIEIDSVKRELYNIKQELYNVKNSSYENPNPRSTRVAKNPRPKKKSSPIVKPSRGMRDPHEEEWED